MITRKQITLCASALMLVACTQPDIDGTNPDNGDFGDGRLDRMGHVELGPLIIGTDVASDDDNDTDETNRVLGVADSFNREQPFGLNVSEANRAKYIDALQSGLLRYDNYDSNPIDGIPGIGFLQELAASRDNETPDPTRLDWVDDLDTLHPLIAVYMTDALFVDIAMPCPSTGTYFEPELAALAGQENQSCGGRHPSDDVLDTFATMLINGVSPRQIHPDDLAEMSQDDQDDVDPYPNRGDSVTEPHVAISNQFPYLTEPYKRFFGN